MTRGERLVAILLGGAVVVVVLVVAGARAAQSWYETATDPTRQQAEQLGYRLSAARTSDPTTLAQVADARGAEVLVAEDVSPCEVAGTEVGCARIVVRLEMDVQEWMSTRHVESCWEYTLRNSVDDHEPNRVDCPEEAASIDIPPTTLPPQLPAGIHDTLAATLIELVNTGTVDEASVRAGVTAIAGADPVVVDVVTVDGDVGVVIGIPSEADCVAGRIVDGTTVEVWQVPHVYAQPGEGGCGAGTAATGWSQHPPH